MDSQHIIDEVSTGIENVANKLDCIYEGLGVRAGVVEDMTPAGLRGLIAIIADLGRELRDIRARLVDG